MNPEHRSGYNDPGQSSPDHHSAGSAARQVPSSQGEAAEHTASDGAMYSYGGSASHHGEEQTASNSQNHSEPGPFAAGQVHDSAQNTQDSAESAKHHPEGAGQGQQQGYSSPWQSPQGGTEYQQGYPSGGFPGTGAPQPGYGAPHGPVPTGDVPVETAKTWAILAHLAVIIGALLSVGYLGAVGPLVLWLIYKDRSPLIRGAAAGSFNFAITLLIASFISTIVFVTLGWTLILLPIPLLMWLAVIVAGIVFPILAAMAASRGEVYRYPLTLPILS